MNFLYNELETKMLEDQNRSLAENMKTFVCGFRQQEVFCAVYYGNLNVLNEFL
jgi:hypothetical protein